MIIIIISFIDNLALFYLSLDGTLFPDELSKSGNYSNCAGDARW